VFLINGFTKGNWHDAFFFAIALAVGLTPEMLPMVVAVCLSKGAIRMSRERVIVKRLNAIQNLGAMDVLCTDKTGTLTMDRVILERHCDVSLQESEAVLALAYMNSHFQTGLKNVLDRAVLAHTETHAHAQIPEYAKVDEVPFDFQRRIMSVVVRTPAGQDLVISKGAPEAIFPRCVAYTLAGTLYPMDHAHIDTLRSEYERLSTDGFRVLAIASKEIAPRGIVGGDSTPYSQAHRRQRSQIRQDGREQQLREHVQRLGSERIRSLSAHDADSDSHQQSALRYQPDRHSYRREMFAIDANHTRPIATVTSSTH
jgi:P-type Mg2+ transporter